jgi:hypothetical protein
MQTQPFSAREWLKANWFFLAAAFVVLGDFSAMHHIAASRPRLLEAALLGDFVVVLPCLYGVCYRSRGKKAWVRALALACLGIWAVSKLLPQDAQPLVVHLGPFRYLGMAVLALLEAQVVLAVYRAVFRGASVEQAAKTLQEKTDMPAWVARLAALEAAFWRRVASAIAKFFRTK